MRKFKSLEMYDKEIKNFLSTYSIRELNIVYQYTLHNRIYNEFSHCIDSMTNAHEITESDSVFISNKIEDMVDDYIATHSPDTSDYKQMTDIVHKYVDTLSTRNCLLVEFADGNFQIYKFNNYLQANNYMKQKIKHSFNPEKPDTFNFDMVVYSGVQLGWTVSDGWVDTDSVKKNWKIIFPDDIPSFNNNL